MLFNKRFGIRYDLQMSHTSTWKSDRTLYSVGILCWWMKNVDGIGSHGKNISQTKLVLRVFLFAYYYYNREKKTVIIKPANTNKYSVSNQTKQQNGSLRFWMECISKQSTQNQSACTFSESLLFRIYSWYFQRNGEWTSKWNIV